MTPFASLSALARSFFAMVSLVLCLTYIGSAILAAVRRRYRFTVFSLLLLAPGYFIWQTVFDLTLPGGAEPAAVSRALGALPWIYWSFALAVLTAGAIILLVYNIRYDKAFITPNAIKLFLDEVHCGICCWKDNGRVLFSNVCMSELCVAVTGEPLLNGEHFRLAVNDGIMTVGGKVWRFACRDILYGGETLREMTASDVTDEYAKTAALERDKAELSRINRELSDYTLKIDDTVRMKEILQAKANIHNEMNRLMLSTVAADGGDTGELDRIFSLWERNALLLCMEAERTTDAKAADGPERLAEALKIRLIWKEPPPAALSEKQRGLFRSAAQEAIVNAVKHAGADAVTVSFEETDAFIRCRFTNGGDVPSGAIRFTGGLANLSLLAERQGASIAAEGGDLFTLCLTFPKEG